MPEASATDERLRALHELRCAGGCTNWFTNEDLDAERSPTAEEIDWTGFPGAADSEGEA